MEVKGKISKILDRIEGESEKGKWVKQDFIVSNNEGFEGAEQIFCFGIFGEDKVNDFNKYNSVGKDVEVSFNIRTNEYKGKYYTSLGAWKVFGASQDSTSQAAPVDNSDDLPF